MRDRNIHRFTLRQVGGIASALLSHGQTIDQRRAVLMAVKLALKMRRRGIAAGIGDLAHRLVRLHLGDGASSMAVRVRNVSFMVASIVKS